MVGAEAQVLTVILWLIALKILQISIYPLLRPTLGEIAYPLSYPLSLLAFTLFSWYAGLLHLPVQLAALFFLLLGSVMLIRKEYVPEDLKRNLRWDAVFLAGFLYLLEIRFFNPSISFAEKFMDHAFLASVMRNPVVPPPDPWFAGGDLSIYYYLGHWMAGALGITIGGESVVVFNLMLPTVAGMAVVAAAALGYLLIPRYFYLPAAVLLIPNPAAVWHLIAGTPVDVLPWESTRVITGTITEYPLFSFFWGDPHAHILGIFNQILFITLCMVLYLGYGDLSLRSRYVLALLLALSLGTMPGVNSWDVLLYAPFYCLIALLTGIRYAGWDLRGWLPLLSVPPLSILLYAPFLAAIEGAGILGVGIVPEGSSLVEFILVHGFFLAIFLMYGLKDLSRYPWLLALPLLGLLTGYGAAGLAGMVLLLLAVRRSGRPEEILGMAGLAVIIFCELIYLKDNMGEFYYRMNTVFKFSMVAWVMMGLSTTIIIGRWLSRQTWPCALPPWAVRSALAAGILFLIVIPPFTPLTYGYATQTLDGSAWLQEAHPGDAAAITYLRSLDGDLRIIEAVGEGYSYAGRISSFTGIPTILGWQGHELVWRSNEDGWYGRRIADVRSIYQDPGRSLPLLEEYGITHLIVGPLENERYRVHLPDEGLILVFEADGTLVYEVAP
ncbi:YYY domain-containing protein [Methanocalculus alkaliphilus]|uniref:DUF2298 domain-containing protein n=1 Tax=Methanocalculus alkaliphilus TaxID=768730 RepID=UPI0020A10B11|nr:DUF2298 domain-containing protein [Methanocalculus alkaliphilus]MCP1715750.1 YYY domain-containing protein [Methanocalculus alkaliphilus]